MKKSGSSRSGNVSGSNLEELRLKEGVDENRFEQELILLH